MVVWSVEDLGTWYLAVELSSCQVSPYKPCMHPKKGKGPEKSWRC